MRQLMLVIVLLAAALLSGCGCGDDRVPSSIGIELNEPLAPNNYSFTVCVDDECTQFANVPAIGESSVGGMSDLNTTDDQINYFTFNAIAPGIHHLSVILADPTGTVLSFEGDLDFTQVDRCHYTDSSVTLIADQLTTGSDN